MSTLIRPARAGAFLLISSLAVLAFAMYVGMHHAIQDNNEGLYARVALEMLERHSWIVPTIDGVPYMEKPPLLYWITAASFALLGTGEAAARLAPLTGSLLLIAALYVFARRWWSERTGVIAACVAASCPIVIVMARMLMFDMLFTGLYTWAILAMYEGVARDGGRRWVRVSYAALALAVMTKGLAGLAFYGALVLATVLESRALRGKRSRLALDGVGLAIFAALAVPWHVAAALTEPEFAWFYFVNEHALRFLGRRLPHDYYGGPPWYYLPRVVLGLAPWILVFATPRPRGVEETGLRRFLWLAFLVPFTFFSISGAKANYYIVVAVPPLVMLLARRLDRMEASRWAAIVPAGWTLFFALLWLAGIHYRMPPPANAPLLGACAIALAAVSALAFLNRRVMEGTAASAAIAIPLALLFSGHLNRNDSSTREIAAEIERRGLDPVFVYRDYEAMSSLGYYLHRPIGIIDSASNDLWYGMRLHPNAARFPPMSRFAADPRYRTAAIVVANGRKHELLASPIGRQLELVAHVGRASVFLRRDGR